MLRMSEVQMRYHETRIQVTASLAINRITAVEAIHIPTCRSVTAQATKKMRSVPRLEERALAQLTRAVYG